jgi:hypothetical protein
MPHLDEQAPDDDAVIAAEDARNVSGVAVQQFGFEIEGGIDFRVHGPTPPQSLGSGYAGLGDEP